MHKIAGDQRPEARIAAFEIDDVDAKGQIAVLERLAQAAKQREFHGPAVRGKHKIEIGEGLQVAAVGAGTVGHDRDIGRQMLGENAAHNGKVGASEVHAETQAEAIGQK